VRGASRGLLLTDLGQSGRTSTSELENGKRPFSMSHSQACSTVAHVAELENGKRPFSMSHSQACSTVAHVAKTLGVDRKISRVAEMEFGKF